MKRISLIPLIFCCFSTLFFPFRIIQVPAILVILIYSLAFFLSRYLYYSVSVFREKKIYYCKNGSSEYTDFTVVNNGFFPLDNLIIHDKGSGCYNNSEGVFMDSIFSRSKKKYSCKLITQTRGCHKVGPIVLKGGDPFNFFPWEKTIHNYVDVIIYPGFHPLHLLLKNGETGGRQKVKNPLYEDLTDLKSIREFRPGDSMKRVNWKATAKSDVLQTMEFADNLSAPLFVLADLTPRNFPVKQRYSRIERTIEAAASLITEYGVKRENCGLLVKGGAKDLCIPPGREYGHIISMLEGLAGISVDDRNSESSLISTLFQNGIKPAAGTHLYIFVPLISEELEREMELLYRRRCHVHLVVTGGQQPDRIPRFCRLYFLSVYGKEYFDA